MAYVTGLEEQLLLTDLQIAASPAVTDETPAAGPFQGELNQHRSEHRSLRLPPTRPHVAPPLTTTTDYDTTSLSEVTHRFRHVRGALASFDTAETPPLSLLRATPSPSPTCRPSLAFSSQPQTQQSSYTYEEHVPLCTRFSIFSAFMNSRFFNFHSMHSIIHWLFFLSAPIVNILNYDLLYLYLASFLPGNYFLPSSVIWYYKFYRIAIINNIWLSNFSIQSYNIMTNFHSKYIISLLLN